MARKTKKPLRMKADEIQNRSAPVKIPAVLYARLSKADADTGKDSMVNQLQLLRTYAEQIEELEVVKEFCDDGFSGTNFKRPAYEEMMEGVHDGRYRCVVVKDLSRLGRSYLETSDLLEFEFPLFGCRFISVNDGIDTKYAQVDTILTGLKNIMNQKYAEDLSRKIKAAFQPKIQNGDFLGGPAPYGYSRDPENKARLMVNEDTAAVVRKIFRMKAERMSDTEVVDWLNKEGIPTPSAYNRMQKTGELPARQKKWITDTVRTITINPAYLGHVVHGKFKEKQYLGQKDERSKRTEWVVYENINPAIIPQELFDEVQRIRPTIRGSRRRK